MEIGRSYRLVITAFLLFALTVGLYEYHSAVSTQSDTVHPIVNMQQQTNNGSSH